MAALQPHTNPGNKKPHLGNQLSHDADELLALCDTLKTNVQNAQTTQLALADALIEQAVN